MSGASETSGAIHRTRAITCSSLSGWRYSSRKSTRVRTCLPAWLRRKRNRLPWRSANRLATCRLVTIRSSSVVVDQFQPTDRADRRGQRGAMLLQALLQAGQRRFVEDTVLHQQHRPALEQDDRLAEAPRVEERGVGFRRHALAQVVGDLLAAGVVRRHVAPLTAGGEVGEFLAGALFLQYRADPQFFRRGPPGVALAHGHVPRWADIPGRSLAEGHDRAMSRWRTAAQLNRRTAGRPGCGFPPSTDSRWLATPPPARRAPRPAPAIRPAPDRRRRRGCGSGTG